MKRFWTAFQNTCRGMNWALRNETAVIQETIALVLAIPLSFFVSSSGWVRLALVGSVLLLLVTELLNTAIEKLCDHLSPEHSEQVMVIKDLGSAAVFFALVVAAVTWLWALYLLFV